MKRQVVHIHGGDVFDTHDDYIRFLKEWVLDFESLRENKIKWPKNLPKDLGEDFEVLLPEMPNKYDAKYAEWKIWLEKLVPYLNDEVILSGHSLGGSFLAKYLSENKFPKKILALFLVAPAYDSEGTEESMGDFIMPEDFSELNSQVSNVFIYQSKDDVVVPFPNLLKFQKQIPGAQIRIFENSGHFNTQESFPELVEDIQSI